jgi:hypothetical protein
MILTSELYEQAIKPGGSLNRNQILLLGERWPLVSGWKRRIIGRNYNEETIKTLLNLRIRKQKKRIALKQNELLWDNPV